MAKKKVQAVSFDDLKKLVVNEAKNNNNVLTQEPVSYTHLTILWMFIIMMK